jgi:hypothetical protein
VRVGKQRPAIEFRHPSRSSAADDVIVMAKAAGLELDDWQRYVLEGALGERGDGKWTAFEVGLVVPRQNGKSALIEALIMTALFVWETKMIVYSAHQFDSAQEVFMRLQQLIEDSEFSDQVAKVYTANGKEAIVLKNGCRVKVKARSKGSGRGFTGDLIIFDEAYDLPSKITGSMIPALSARSMRPDTDVQVWYCSSAAHSHSVKLHELCSRSTSDDPGRLYYADWRASETAADDDVAAWYEANPALGVRISEEFVRDELNALQSAPEEFRRERLGIPDPLPSEDGPPAKLDLGKWADAVTLRPPTLAPGEMSMAFDVVDGWSSISVASGSLGAAYVACIHHQSGVGWLPARLVELVRKWRPTVVGLDGGCGPAVAALGEVRELFEIEGLDPELLRPLTSGEYKAACGGFVQAVDDGKLARPQVEPDQLDTAGRLAAARVIGDAFVWDRRTATVPLSPLVAATCARALLPEGAVGVHTVSPVFEWMEG